jgi:hypothetical protein
MIRAEWEGGSVKNYRFDGYGKGTTTAKEEADPYGMTNKKEDRTQQRKKR